LDTHHLGKIRALVGQVSEEQLKFVDCFVGDELGLFIPTIGPCLYAVTRDHSHPAYSFVLSFDDNSTFQAKGDKITPAPGEVVAIDPEAMHHEVSTEEQPRYIAIFISRAIYQREARPYALTAKPYNFRRFLPGPELVGLLKEFMAEREAGLPGVEAVLAAISTRIVHSILRAAHGIESPAPQIASRIEINRVVEYLHGNYGKKVTVDEMAAVAAISASHFSRVFRKETGFAPMNYLIHLRLTKARRLLVAGEPCVTSVALRCGFASSSHFTDSFRKRFGCRPSDVMTTIKA
jgi:AraC family transcriptional regulator